MKDTFIFILVLIFSSLGHIATDIYLPSMPHIATYFETSDALVKMTFSVYMLSFCLTPLFIGPISDRIGRKRPILFGLYISLFSTILCVFSNSIYLLIFARFLQGIGMGMVVSVSRAILPDHFQGAKLAKCYSYMTMFVPLILAIAPPLGGFIQEYSSWRMVFGVLLTYVFIIWALAQFAFIEHKKTSVETKRLSAHLDSYKDLLKNKKYRVYTLCTVFTMMGISAYLTICPFIFQNLLGLTPTENGLTAILFCAAVSLVGFINAKLVNVFASKTLLLGASFLMLLSGIMLVLFNEAGLINFYTFLLSAFLFFSTIPISFANAGSLALMDLRGNFGSATALASSLQFAGGALSSIIVSLASNGVLILGVAFLSLGIAYFLILSSLKENTVAVAT